MGYGLSPFLLDPLAPLDPLDPLDLLQLFYLLTDVGLICQYDF